MSDFGDETQCLVKSEPCLGENPFAFAIDGGQFQVTDFTAGPDQSPVLFRITGDGKRQIISNFRDPGQGPLGAVPIAISLTAFDDVLVLDLEGNRDLFRINSTGQREVLVANIGIEPSGIAVLSVPLVLAADAGRRARGALFVLDPVSGECHMLSDFGNLRQCREDSDDVEYLGLNPSTVAVVESGAGPFAGKILVVDADAGTSRLGAVFSVDPATGHRDLLADFGNPAQCRQSPCPPAAFQPFTAFGLAVRRPTGELFVSDSGFGPFRGGCS